MLINTIPIIEFDEFKSNKNFPDNSTIGVCINFEQLQSQDTIQFLFDVNLPHFICIDFISLENKNNLLENIRHLVLLSFNINYYKINNNPVIAILDNNQNLNKIISEINNEFLKQGYDNIELFELNENNNNLSEKTNCLFIAKDIEKNELDSYYNLFFDENIINKLFFIYSTIDKSKSIIEKINRIEKAFANTENKLYAAFESIQKLKAENKLLKNEKSSLNARIQNEEINRKLLRKDARNIINWHKNEIEKIKDWYNLQYEILPLWYKRIGHIIKKLIKKNDRIKQ